MIRWSAALALSLLGACDGDDVAVVADVTLVHDADRCSGCSASEANLPGGGVWSLTAMRPSGGEKIVDLCAEGFATSIGSLGPILNDSLFRGANIPEPVFVMTFAVYPSPVTCDDLADGTGGEPAMSATSGEVNLEEQSVIELTVTCHVGLCVL